MDKAELARRSAQLAPWWFKFRFNEIEFGGRVERDTDKVADFALWRNARRFDVIYDVGALEASHSLQLSELACARRVIAIESRAENIAKAEVVLAAYEQEVGPLPTPIELREIDIEKASPAMGSPDESAVFCSGLLYHVAEPWNTIRTLSSLGATLFLDTHVAPYPTITQDNRYSGCWYIEGSDPLSGMNKKSFWLTLDSLLLCLLDHGYVVPHFRSIVNHNHGPRIRLLATRRTDIATSCDWATSLCQSRTFSGRLKQSVHAALRGWQANRHRKAARKLKDK